MDNTAKKYDETPEEQNAEVIEFPTKSATEQSLEEVMAIEKERVEQGLPDGAPESVKRKRAEKAEAERIKGLGGTEGSQEVRESLAGVMRIEEERVEQGLPNVSPEIVQGRKEDKARAESLKETMGEANETTEEVMEAIKPEKIEEKTEVDKKSEEYWDNWSQAA